MPRTPASANDPLQRYRNLSGKSGVVAYRLLANAIVVEFRNGDRYLYTVESAGPASIERMKALARAGVGLCTFISRHVKDAYARKLP